MFPKTRLPRSIATAAAMALALPLTFGATTAAFAADASVDFTATKPTATDVDGATKDVFTIPAVKGVTHYIAKFTGGLNAGRTIVYTPSTSKIPTQGATKVEIQPVAAAGYEIASGDQTIALSFDAATIELAISTAPEAKDSAGRSKDRIVITPVANVLWQIGDAKAIAVTGTTPRAIAVPAAAYAADNAGASVKVKAVPATADYSVKAEGAETTLTFKDKEEVALTQADVTATDALGISKDKVTLKHVAGVKWAVNGKAVSVPVASVKNPTPTVTVAAGKDTEVVASIAAPKDYIFKSDSVQKWTRADLTALKADKAEVDPVAPTGTDAPLFAKDKITLTGAEGLEWQVTSGPVDKRVTKKFRVAAGKTQTVPAGDTPEVLAVVTNEDDYAVKSGAKATWSAADLQLSSDKGELAAPAVPTKKDDLPGTKKDTVTLTGVDGVTYLVGTAVDAKGVKKYAPKPGVTVVAPVPSGASVFAIATRSAEWEFAADVTTSWSRSDLGLADTKTDIGTLDAPVGTDLPGLADKVTLTGVEGVQWRIDDKKVVKVAVGKSVTVVGRSVAAEPTDDDAWAITASTKAWDAAALALTDGDVKVKVDPAPAGTNAPGVTKDTVTLTGIAKVTYKIGTKTYRPAPGKTQTVPMRPTDTVTAVGNPAPNADKGVSGYVIDGTSEWTGETLGLQADTTKVAVTAPVFNDEDGVSKDHVVITGAANIVWTVNGAKVSPAAGVAQKVSTKGVADVKVTAAGKTADFEVDGTVKEWSNTYAIAPVAITLTAPTADTDARAVKLTKKDGVIWKIDGKTVNMVNAVQYVVIPTTKTEVTVTATAANAKDYTISGDTSWTLSVVPTTV